MNAASLVAAATIVALAPATLGAQTIVTPADRTEVVLTVYDGFAQVHDSRRVDVPGSGLVTWTGLPEELDPATVVLTAAGRPVDVLAQSFDAARLAPDVLLGRALGSEVALLRSDGGRLTGELVSVDGPVVRTGDELVLEWDGPIAVPDVPDGVVAERALRWQLGADAGARELTADYLVDELTWSADYVAVLGEDPTMSLSGRVTVDNQTDTTWEDARLVVVAGDIRRARQPGPPPRPFRATMEMAQADDQVEREPFADVHRYEIDSPITLVPRSTSQVPLFRSVDVVVERTYVLEGQPYWFQAPPQTIPDRQHPRIRITFDNEDVAGEDAPLPAGRIHTYQQDSDGDLVFTGSAPVPDVPAGERVEIETGTAFDVVAERTRTALERIDDRTTEVGWRIEIRNRGSEARTVRVVEPVAGETVVLEESRPHERVDASTLAWTVPVPAESSAALTYRLRITQ